jgi:hypothetical protein
MIVVARQLLLCVACKLGEFFWLLLFFSFNLLIFFLFWGFCSLTTGWLMAGHGQSPPVVDHDWQEFFSR